ncbi:MAG: T9SS type A sorting domain-containing protein [Bacteroidales bacterium]|nr:T9SS type A sorting domain-containing protein [Bacteroidales bacterium]
MKTILTIWLVLTTFANCFAADPVNLYSHRSGQWTDFNSWTTDPSGINFVNPGEDIPGPGTNVYIIPGASITVPDTYNTGDYLINCANLKLDGELVLNGKMGHNVAGVIEGDGRIVLHIENYPACGTNKFVLDGGTTVFQGATVSLTSGHSYSNLEINNSVVIFAGNINIDGNLSVVSGGSLIFKSDAASSVYIKDDLQVNNSCSISVDPTSKPFDLYIGGDLRNDGTIKFTNRQDYKNETSDEDYVRVHFDGKTRNQTVSCNNVIDFYSIYMEKGTSDNYTLRFTAYNKQNFHIYGPAVDNTTQNIILDGGTLEIGSNIVIPFLHEDSFYIPASSTILVNAGILNSDPDVKCSIFVEGKLQVAYTGEINAMNDADGITLKKSGILEVDGGKLTAACIKNGIEGDDYGSYYQIGGNVVVDNGSEGTMFFCLDNPNSGFLMKSGVLTINHGGLKILSSSANCSVEGGEVILKSTKGNYAKLWSTAAFPSLTIESTNAMTVEPEPGYPLKVTGNLTVGKNCTMSYNLADVYVAGNLDCKGTFVCSENTIFFNGDGNTELSLPNNNFNFGNLTICKSTPTATVTTDKSFSVSKNLTITGGTFVNGEHHINVNLDISVENGGISSTTGYIKLANNSHIHTLTSPLHNPCCFGNLHYAGTENLIIEGPVITQNFEFDGTNSHLVELNGHYVEVKGELLGAGSTKYFINKGDISGGLCLHFTLKKGEDKTINFPIGDNVGGNKYTPAEIVVTGSMLPQDYTGSVRVNVVSKSHPNLLSTNNMQRFWVFSQKGFEDVPNGAVRYNFTNSSTISNSYIAAGLVAFKGWKHSEIAVDGSDKFSFYNSGYGLISGDFTCAQNTDYDIKLYRTWSQTAPTKTADDPMYRMDQSDHDKNDTWRLLDENGEETDIPGVPGAHDIAYIYFNRVDVREKKHWEVGQLVFVDTESLYAPDDLEHQPRLQVHPQADVTIHMLSGEGVIAQYIGNSDNIVHINDITTFAKESHSWMMYILTADVTDVEGYPELPNLALEDAHEFSFGTTSKVINFDLNMRGQVKYIFPDDAGGNLYIGRDLYVGDWQGAQVLFNRNGEPHTLTVKGDVILSHNGNPKAYGTGVRNITINDDNAINSACLEHRLIVGGNIHLGSKKLQLSKIDDVKTTGIILELDGDKDAELFHIDPTTGSTGTLEFWKIVMNKEKGKSFTINRDFVLKSAEAGMFAGNLQPITMKSGRLVLNNNTNNRNYLLTPDDNVFVIPADAALETTGKAKYTLSSGISLSGGLKLDNASVWTVGQSIEYTESATCELNIGNATMNVGAQLRPPIAAGGSINLILSHDKSVLNVGTNSTIGYNGRGIFELVNMSSLTMANGAQLVIKNYIDNTGQQTILPDININPNVCNLDPGSKIIVAAGQPEFTTILSKVDIPCLTVKSSSHLKMMGALTVTENLSVESSNDELSAGGFELYLKGNANFAGTFTPAENTTYICGTNDQEIKGNITFYNLVKNTTNTVSFDKTITIENQADFLKGTFIGKCIIAKGNVVNNAEYVCNSYSNALTDGFIFRGSKLQTLKSDGNGSFTKILIDNSAGVKLPTGNSFTVIKRFQLNQGNFDLGTCTFTMDKEAIFILASGVSYSATNMIQVTDAYATGGVRKLFPGPKTDYLIPIGTTGKYTPVTINANSINDGAALTIRPVNEMTNCKPGNSVLGYFWTMKAENVNDFSGSFKFKFSSSETVPSSMVGVFHCDATDEFTKFSGAWNNSKKELTFSFSGVSSDALSGKYLGSAPGDITAGVPVYYAEGFEGEAFADWNEKSIWYTIDGEGNPQPVAEVPSNVVVHIYKNVTMKNVPATGVTECKVYIEDGAVLDQDLSMHNDFGTVLGKGTLKSQTGDLPAGVYDEFNSANGGTLHYYGGGSEGTGYSILKQMPVVNNLIIQSEGAGEIKKFPGMDVQILGDFTINGNVNNEANAVISLKGDLNYKYGHFTTGNLGRSKFVFNGDETQIVSGLDFTEDNCIFNMVINNPNGVELHNNVFVHNTIEFIQGIITASELYDGLLTLDNSESNSIFGFGPYAYVDGPFRKRINNGEFYTFPVGNTNGGDKRYGPLTIQNTNTNGSVYWTVQYVYDMPPEWDNYDDDLLSISTNEYWKIYSEDDSYQAQILTRWDGATPIMHQSLNPENIRQVYFNRSEGKWELSGSHVTIDGNNGYVESFTARNITASKGEPDLFSFGFQTKWNYCWCGTFSDDWFDKRNWIMDFTPTYRTQVKIGGDCPNWPVIGENPKGADKPATCGSLMLCDEATLDIESRGKLTVTTDVTVQPTAKLTLRADKKTEDNNHSIPPTGSLIYGGNFDGKLTFQRFVRAYEFERMCVPVAGFNADVANFSRYAWIYSYNEGFILDEDHGVNYIYEDGVGDEKNPEILSSAWINGATIYPGSFTTPYRYISYPQLAPHALSFTGTPMTDATQNVKVDVTFSENDIVTQPGFQPDMLDGWNLIANPFVSAVDATKLEFHNVDKVIYLHDNIDDSPLVFALEAGVPAGVVTTYNEGRYIPAGQSFFVHAKNTSEEKSVVFTPQSRSHGSEAMKIKSGSNEGNSDLDKIIFLTNGLGQDFQSVVYFANDATEGFDSRFDAYLQTSKVPNVLQFYSFGSDYKVPLIVNGLPGSVKDGGEIRLGYTTVTGGTYTLSIPTNSVTGTTVYLKDTENGTLTPISDGFSCKITVAAGTNNSRFKLVFANNTAPVAKTSIADAKGVENENFEYKIGTDLFADNDQGDYVANIDVTSDGGSALPSWLSFNYESGMFVGKPAASGVYRIAITATDSHGAKSLPLTFAITIEASSVENGNNDNNDLPLVNDDSNLVTVEDPVIPILVNPHDPMPIEPVLPIIVDPVLPEVDDNHDVTVTEPTIDDNTQADDNNGPEELPLVDPMIPLVDEPLVDPFNQDHFADSDVRVYPVPSNGRVTVEYGSLIQDFGSVQMTIVSISGRIILTKTLYGNKVDLDLTGRTGIYLIRLATPSKTITKRIMIQ